MLTHRQAERFYDRFGRRQDSQAFYEDEAIDSLIEHGEFDEAGSVFELGPGTGRLAERLLDRHLPNAATYLGFDVSQTMVDLTRQRIARFGDRAEVWHSDGTIRFPLEDSAVDRVVSTYVLDLLEPADIRRVLGEAQRVVVKGGRLCLAGLTWGNETKSLAVSAAWAGLAELVPQIVGGCRPMRIHRYLLSRYWRTEVHEKFTRLGITSEVVVATRIK